MGIKSDFHGLSLEGCPDDIRFDHGKTVLAVDFDNVIETTHIDLDRIRMRGITHSAPESGGAFIFDLVLIADFDYTLYLFGGSGQNNSSAAGGIDMIIGTQMHRSGILGIDI